MSNVTLISRESLEQEFYKKLANHEATIIRADEAVDIVDTKFGISGITSPDVALIDRAQPLASVDSIKLSGNYLSGFDLPFEERGSINDRARANRFSSSTNTLEDSWSDLFDAMRLDMTIRKTAKQTVRQFFYDEVLMPNATPSIKPQEMFPYAFEFGQIDGQGQPVTQGVKMGGKYDSIDFNIYATGFTYTLLLSLFDRTFDITRMNDGVALAYALKRDALAMDPILDYDYGVAGTAKHTAAYVDEDMDRQELLYNTLIDAIDDLGERKELNSGEVDEYIKAENLTVLCSTYDAHHIQPLISGGLPSVNEKKYPGISAITKIVTYDTQSVRFPDRTLTYSGVSAGTIYICKKNQYMMIPIKRGLTMEIDAQPDVKTLSKEERAWYFCEGIFNLGIGSYIQKVTLPDW